MTINCNSNNKFFQSKIQKHLVDNNQVFTIEEFTCYGIEGVLPKHMPRLIKNISLLEGWFFSAKYHHIYNFFGFLDERDRLVEFQKKVEKEAILIVAEEARLKEQLCKVQYFAEKHKFLLSQKRSLMIFLNEYKVETGEKKWFSEVEYFITNVAQVDIDEKNKFILFDAVESIAKDNQPKFSSNHRVSTHEIGYQFETECAEILQNNGWLVTRTKSSGDQGVDLIANIESLTVALQCKKYSSPVGNKAVQEVYAGGSFMQCDFYVVVSNTSFTNSAKQLAQKLGVYLINQQDLVKLLDLLKCDD
jgi:restriction system protein